MPRLLLAGIAAATFVAGSAPAAVASKHPVDCSNDNTPPLYVYACEDVLPPLDHGSWDIGRCSAPRAFTINTKNSDPEDTKVIRNENVLYLHNGKVRVVITVGRHRFAYRSYARLNVTLYFEMSCR